MAWSYDDSLPSAKDRARSAVGDIDVSNPLRSDALINALLAANSEAEAIARLAEGLAAEFGMKPDSIGADGQSISWRERVKTWLELAKRARDSASAAVVLAGSGSWSRAATRGEESGAEYLRPTSWTWQD